MANKKDLQNLTNFNRLSDTMKKEFGYDLSDDETVKKLLESKTIRGCDGKAIALGGSAEQRRQKLGELLGNGSLYVYKNGENVPRQVKMDEDDKLTVSDQIKELEKPKAPAMPKIKGPFTFLAWAWKFWQRYVFRQDDAYNRYRDEKKAFDRLTDKKHIKARKEYNKKLNHDERQKKYEERKEKKEKTVEKKVEEPKKTVDEPGKKIDAPKAVEPAKQLADPPVEKTNAVPVTPNVQSVQGPKVQNTQPVNQTAVPPQAPNAPKIEPDAITMATLQMQMEKLNLQMAQLLQKQQELMQSMNQLSNSMEPIQKSQAPVAKQMEQSLGKETSNQIQKTENVPTAMDVKKEEELSKPLLKQAKWENKLATTTPTEYQKQHEEELSQKYIKELLKQDAEEDVKQQELLKKDENAAKELHQTLNGDKPVVDNAEDAKLMEDASDLVDAMLEDSKKELGIETRAEENEKQSKESEKAAEELHKELNGEDAPKLDNKEDLDLWQDSQKLVDGLFHDDSKKAETGLSEPKKDTDFAIDSEQKARALEAKKQLEEEHPELIEQEKKMEADPQKANGPSPAEELLAHLQENQYKDKEIPENVRNNVQTLYQNSEKGRADLTALCEQNGKKARFVGGDAVRDMMAFKDMQSRILRGDAAVTGLLESPQCVDYQKLTAGASGPMTYASKNGHYADYYQKNFLNASGLEALCGKHQESVTPLQNSLSDGQKTVAEQVTAIRQMQFAKEHPELAGNGKLPGLEQVTLQPRSKEAPEARHTEL